MKSRHSSLALSLTTLALVLAGAVVSPLAPASSASSPPPVSEERKADTGLVGFIGTSPGRPIDTGASPGASAAAVATGFLRSNARRLGLAGAGTDVQVTSQHRASSGGQTVRVAQVHQGLRVLGGAFTVNLDENRDVLSVLGEASPIGDVTTSPEVTAGAARRSAVAKVARGEQVKRGLLRSTRPELMFYDPRLLGAPGPFQTARLSWVMEVGASELGVRHQVVVDALTGSVALNFSMINESRFRVVCDANNQPVQFPCLNPVWTELVQPGGQDDDVAKAFDYAGDTYDFFYDHFGRDSLDDRGLALVSTVDFCPDPVQQPCPYPNAFWDGSEQQMVYGDGFASADDVVGHELTHGFTDFSSSLFYYMQSGAINESMSDIFGELIDQANGAGTDTAGVRWLLGEDVPGIGAIRDMATPAIYSQPDRMGSPLYYVGGDDSGGVHYNSGVGNKTAYLLVDGDTFNGHTVAPIGATKTARLFYTVNNDLLTSASDYADLANALRQACTNLAGSGTDGFTTSDCDEVEQALLATEMDVPPTGGAVRDATVCPSGQPSYIYRDDLETPFQQFTGVAMQGVFLWSYPQGYPVPGPYATSGEKNLYGYNQGDYSDTAVQLTYPVRIPPDAVLHFNHAYGFEDDAFDTYDGGVVEYSTSGKKGPWIDAGPLFAATDGANGYVGTVSPSFNNPLAGRAGFVGDSYGYGASRADLSSLAGQDVMFRWRIGTDNFLDDYGWFIDDISIAQCGVVDTTPPNTKLGKHPKKRTKARKTTFTFSAPGDPMASFRCQLDGKAWKSCSSPKRFRVKPGKHVFRVRATDLEGNVDTSPAAWTWRVRR